MTKNKRFDMDYEEIYGEIIYFDNGNVMTDKEVLDRLNQFNEENEILKSTNMEYEDALGRLEEENEKLKQRINSRLHFYRELYESTNDKVVERVIEDLEDILKR